MKDIFLEEEADRGKYQAMGAMLGYIDPATVGAVRTIVDYENPRKLKLKDGEWVGTEFPEKKVSAAQSVLASLMEGNHGADAGIFQVIPKKVPKNFESAVLHSRKQEGLLERAKGALRDITKRVVTSSADREKKQNEGRTSVFDLVSGVRKPQSAEDVRFLQELQQHIFEQRKQVNEPVMKKRKEWESPATML